jgi:hypothetical protein
LRYRDRYIVGLPHHRTPVTRPAPPARSRIVWFTEGIFRQDRWIVELEQAAFDAQGADWNQEIFPVIQGLRTVLRDNGVPLAGAV